MKCNLTCSAYIMLTILLFPPLSFSAQAPNPVENLSATVCEQCHGNQSGRGGAPVKLWKQSIHASNGISCNGCHGGDPNDAANAMNIARGFLGVPKEKDIPGFCGRCHIGIRDDYLRSAHGRMLGRGGPTCVTCHSSHEVRSASIDIINETTCGGCHAYGPAALIKDAMKQTDADIVRTEQSINLLKRKGFDTLAKENSLFALKNRYHRLFHEISLKRIEDESKSIGDELKKIQNWLDTITLKQHKRKIGGAGVVGGFLLIALFCYLLKRSYN